MYNAFAGPGVFHALALRSLLLGGRTVERRVGLIILPSPTAIEYRARVLDRPDESSEDSLDHRYFWPIYPLRGSWQNSRTAALGRFIAASHLARQRFGSLTFCRVLRLRASAGGDGSHNHPAGAPLCAPVPTTLARGPLRPPCILYVDDGVSFLRAGERSRPAARSFQGHRRAEADRLDFIVRRRRASESRAIQLF